MNEQQGYIDPLQNSLKVRIQIPVILLLSKKLESMQIRLLN